jgi:transcriptional regulator with XRE-family HTH domain
MNPSEKEKTLKDTFTKNIILLRKVKGIKQATLCQALGIGQSEYSNLEAGKKNNWKKYWEPLADIYGIPSYQLGLKDCVITNKNGKIEIKVFENNNSRDGNKLLRLWNLWQAKNQKALDENIKQIENLKNDVKTKESKITKLKKQINQLIELIRKSDTSVNSNYGGNKDVNGSTNESLGGGVTN